MPSHTYVSWTIHLEPALTYLSFVRIILYYIPQFQITKPHIVFPHQMTPMHWAANSGSVDTVEYLIQKGADIYSRDDDEVRLYYTDSWLAWICVNLVSKCLAVHECIIGFTNYNVWWNHWLICLKVTQTKIIHYTIDSNCIMPTSVTVYHIVGFFCGKMYKFCILICRLLTLKIHQNQCWSLTNCFCQLVWSFSCLAKLLMESWICATTVWKCSPLQLQQCRDL